mmetsp:Transcript_15993/g.28694  ORF Transcript_15993/g.28694 Transcript_15993/m.28694 type:complete len:200 (+) Transcript_15993:499-1098(+)
MTSTSFCVQSAVMKFCSAQLKNSALEMSPSSAPGIRVMACRNFLCALALSYLLESSFLLMPPLPSLSIQWKTSRKRCLMAFACLVWDPSKLNPSWVKIILICTTSLSFTPLTMKFLSTQAMYSRFVITPSSAPGILAIFLMYFLPSGCREYCLWSSSRVISPFLSMSICSNICMYTSRSAFIPRLGFWLWWLLPLASLL